MIPDKTQELDLRELMARYERDYGSEAEREFFGQDWSKLVATYKGEDSTPEFGSVDDGDVDSQQARTLTPDAGAWGQARPRLRGWLLRSGAGVGFSAGRLPKWLSLSLLVGVTLSGLGWLTLGGAGETTTTSAAPPSSPEPASPSAPPSATLSGGLPATAASQTLDAEPAASSSNRSLPPKSATDAQSTLARQAVDAVLAGDRARALDLYRELSRRAPQSEVYREATRILSRAAAPSTKTPDQRPAPPSRGASAAR